MKCSKCGTQSVRMERSGFLQSRIYSLIGLYPWRCSTCGKRTLAFMRRQPAGCDPIALSHMVHSPPDPSPADSGDPHVL